MAIKLNFDLVSKKYEELLENEEKKLESLIEDLKGYTSELYVIQLVNDTTIKEEQLENLPKIITLKKSEIQKSKEKISYYDNVLKKVSELTKENKEIIIKDWL